MVYSKHINLTYFTTIAIMVTQGKQRYISDTQAPKKSLKMISSIIKISADSFVS